MLIVTVKHLKYFLNFSGKDLTSVQNLLKKHALVEADVNSHQDRIDGVKIASEQFVQAGHFDSENIKAKYSALADRYVMIYEYETNLISHSF